MSNPSYIANNPEELFDRASPEIQELIHGDAVNAATIILGKLYKFPVSSYVALENIISFILIGALKPEDAVHAIVDLLGLSEEEAYKLAADLDKTILEKARIKILGKSPKDLVELTFQEGRSPDELRKEILDTTKRESAFVKEQASSPVPVFPVTEGVSSAMEQIPVALVSPAASPIPAPEPVPATVPPTSEAGIPEAGQTSPTSPVAQAENPVIATPAPTSKKVMAAPGSRSQLLEQLQVLGAIPNDDEITERLSKIQEQISSIESKDSSMLDSNIPLQQFMFGEKGDDAVNPELKAATYSKAPTRYNVDPYRETPEDHL